MTKSRSEARARERARGAVRRAINQGKLVRPSVCSKCGRDPGPGSDGRARIHAHHWHGYSEPLDVEWLCYLCHVAEDPRPCGERNGQSKLTDEAVAEIRRGTGKTLALARKFGVSRRTIHFAKTGVLWRKSHEQ